MMVSRLPTYVLAALLLVCVGGCGNRPDSAHQRNTSAVSPSALSSPDQAVVRRALADLCVMPQAELSTASANALVDPLLNILENSDNPQIISAALVAIYMKQEQLGILQNPRGANAALAASEKVKKHDPESGRWLFKQADGLWGLNARSVMK